MCESHITCLFVCVRECITFRTGTLCKYTLIAPMCYVFEDPTHLPNAAIIVKEVAAMAADGKKRCGFSNVTENKRSEYHIRGSGVFLL